MFLLEILKRENCADSFPILIHYVNFNKKLGNNFSSIPLYKAKIIIESLVLVKQKHKEW